MGTASLQPDGLDLITLPELSLDGLRERVLDEIGIGLIVCEPSGVIRLVNRRAEEELASGRLLRREGRTLQCSGPSNPPLDAAISLAGRRHCRQLVELGEGDQRLMMSVVPLPSGAPQPALVMLMLGSRELCSAQRLGLLSAVHGLTAAEQRVLADLLHEQTPREIAQAHGVSLTTVRSQIVSIRAKFGVHSIEGLLRRVAELPPDLGTTSRRADGVTGARLH